VVAECPYNGWVDEVELCILWNQVQGLQATTQELIILVQQLLAAGRRKREVLTTPSNYVNMSTDEQDTILVLIEVYTCLYECCQTRECNETLIEEMSGKVYQQNQKLKVAYTNMTLHYSESQQYFFDKIGELDSGCTNITDIPGIPGTTTTTTITTTAAPTTTAAVVTTDGCCPEYANTDPIICPILCQLIYGRRLLMRAADDDPLIDIDESEPDDEIVEMMTSVYIFLETRLKCFPEVVRVELPKERARIEEIYTEVSKIKPYVHIQSSYNKFNLIQEKLLGLLEEAKQDIDKSEDFKGDENSSDIVLGCICVIVSPIDKQFSPVKEKHCNSLEEKNVEDNIELVATTYNNEKSGIDVDENKLKKVYLELEQASDCGMIKKKHHDAFHNMLLQHHYKQHHMIKK